MPTRRRHPKRTSKPKQQTVVLQIDRPVAEWWTEAAARTGTSRSALINVVLDIVSNALQVCDEPKAGDSILSLGELLSNGLVSQGLGGPGLRRDVIARLEQRLKTVRGRHWRVPKWWAAQGETKQDVIRRFEARIAAIRTAATNEKPA